MFLLAIKSGGNLFSKSFVTKYVLTIGSSITDGSRLVEQIKERYKESSRLG